MHSIAFVTLSPLEIFSWGYFSKYKKITREGYSFGAQEGIFIKLFERLFAELHHKADIINSFEAHLRYGAKFHENIKTQLLPRFTSPEGCQTFNI
jgi:hypothetical protein